MEPSLCKIPAMQLSEFYIIFSTELEKNSTGSTLFNRYYPPLNLEDYSIALIDIQFSKPNVIPDGSVVLITLDCLDSTVRYGKEQLQLLQLYSPKSGIGNLWYRRVSKAHCETLSVTFLDHELNPLDIRAQGNTTYLTLHCRKEQNS